MVDERGVRALLDPVDRLAVQPGEFTELLLAESSGGTGSTHPVPDAPAAGEDPSGQGIGWHPSTLAALVIFVCTILGTSRVYVSAQARDSQTLKRPFEWTPRRNPCRTTTDTRG